MKKYLKLQVAEDKVSSEQFAGLLRIHPSGRTGALFSAKLETEDPTVAKLLEYLKEQSIEPFSGGLLRRKGYFTISQQREYDTSDFDCASFLKLQHLVKIQEEQERDEEGRLKVAAWRLMPEIKMGCVLFQATIVSDAIRREMEAAGLVGVQFRELALMPSDRPLRLEDRAGNLIREVTPQDADHIEKRGQFWELTSSITLPPLDTSLLVCRGPEPFSGDYSKVITIRDEYMPPELHYRAGDLTRTGPFDFALTFEKFARESWPVVSQRFRQFCLQHDLKLDWIPVRIDPD